MRRFALAIVVAALGGAAGAQPAVAAPGDLDSGFASAGIFTGPSQTVLPAYGDQQVAVDAQGRPLVAWTFDSGSVFDNDGLRVEVARLTTTGQLDTSFNPGGSPAGTRVIDFPDAPGANIRAAGIAPGPNGTVVALGSVEPVDNGKIALVRLTSTGALDGTFSGDGSIATNVSTGYSPTAYDLALDGSGRALVAGASITGCSPLPCEKTPFVARFTSGGTLDSGWDTDGHWEPPGVSGEMFGVAPGPGGGAVASGTSSLEALIVRLTSTGGPDNTFSTDGVQTSTLGSDSGTGSSIPAFGVAADGNNVLVAGQAALSGGFARFAVARFTSNGTPDPAWGTGTPASGVVHLPFPDAVRGADVVPSNGKVVVAGHGFYEPGGGFSSRNALVYGRLTGAGALDSAFAADQATPGMRQLRLGQNATGWRLAMHADGSGFVSGQRWAESGTDVKPVVARFLGDGVAPGGEDEGGDEGGGGSTVAGAAQPQCADAKDNDSDGATDLQDPGCKGASDTSEADETLQDLVLCGRREISLVRADLKGSKVVLSGLVSQKNAGKQVELLANYGGRRKAKGARLNRLARVKAGSNGQFTGRVGRPPRRLLARARYVARVGSSRSVALKLPQSLASSSVRKAGSQIELKGRVKRALLGKKRNPVVVKRLVCGRYQTVGQAKPSRSGAYTVRFPAPTLGAAALYRAETKVLAKRRSKRYVKQFARAIGITLTGQTG